MNTVLKRRRFGIIQTKIFSMLLFAVMFISMNPIGVHAETAVTKEQKKAAIQTIIQDTVTISPSGNIKYSNGAIKAYLTDTPAANGTSSSVAVDIYSADKTQTKQVYYTEGSIEILYKKAQQVDNNNTVNSKVSDLTNDLSIEADTGAAAVMLSGFQPIVSLLIGVLLVLLSFGMSIFSGFDLAYIAFPVFRTKCDEAKQSGNSAMTKTDKNGETKLRWVTDDAIYAVQVATIESGKNPWIIYGKRRCVAYICLGVIMYIIFSGNITLLTQIVLNIVAGVINVATSLA